MSNIFDWDDDVDDKKIEAEVWGAYPLAQPPGTASPAPPSGEKPAAAEQPSTPHLLPAPKQDSDIWNEIDTVIRPRPETQQGWQEFPPYQPDSRPAAMAQQDIHTTSPGDWGEFPPDAYDQLAQPGVWSEYRDESPEETARKGGMAWSAGIVFFSSVAFMLFLGWIFDWLFASSPLGLIGGIVIGSIVGFVQFFRISSRIFKPQNSAAGEHPLM